MGNGYNIDSIDMYISKVSILMLCYLVKKSAPRLLHVAEVPLNLSPRFVNVMFSYLMEAPS